MNLAIDILVWILLWAITFGTFYFMTKRGVTFNKRYGLLILFFLFFSFLAVYYFKDILVNLKGNFTLLPFLIFAFIYITTIALYNLSHKRLQRPTLFIERYPHQHFIKMDYRYLVSMPFQILFQQIMIWIIVLWLSKQNYSLFEIITYFILIFGLLHVFAMMPNGKVFGTYYLIASLIGAFIFPILILKVNYGFVYSYIVHFSFYSISSVLFWLFADKFSERIKPLL